MSVPALSTTPRELNGAERQLLGTLFLFSRWVFVLLLVLKSTNFHISSSLRICFHAGIPATTDRVHANASKGFHVSGSFFPAVRPGRVF